MFVILVFRSGCDKLVSYRYYFTTSLRFTACFFYCLSQGISHGMWLLAWEFLLIKSVLHFAYLHLLSGYYYYDYVVIGVLRPTWLLLLHYVVIGVLRPSWLLLLRLCNNRCAEALVVYRNSLLNRLTAVNNNKINSITIICIDRKTAIKNEGVNGMPWLLWGIF